MCNVITILQSGRQKYLQVCKKQRFQDSGGHSIAKYWKHFDITEKGSVYFLLLANIIVRYVLTHISQDDLNHNGNIPPAWASVGLAVQDSNESFGSVTSSPLFLCSYMK